MSTYTTTKANHRTAPDLIAARQPFSSGGNAYGMPNVRGGANEGTTGSLYGEHLDKFYRDANRIDYVVYSYRTPIAWHTPEGWTVPPVKYSVSTSRHQGMLYEIH